MFRRKPSPLQNDSLQALAGRLGIEARLVSRVRYPERLSAGLPTIHYQGERLRGHDIGAGGCALLDPKQVLSTMAGRDVDLHLHFTNGIERVRSRVLTLVNDRAHIQFQNLAPERQDELHNLTAFAHRAIALRRGPIATREGPALSAREIWSSPTGDALIFEDLAENAPEARAEISGQHYLFRLNGVPLNQLGVAVDQDQLGALILYLANVPKPSPAIVKLQLRLESMFELRSGGRA